MAGAASVHVSIDQKSVCEHFKQELAVMKNTLNELMQMQPLKERIPEIQQQVEHRFEILENALGNKQQKNDKLKRERMLMQERVSEIQQQGEHSFGILENRLMPLQERVSEIQNLFISLENRLDQELMPLQERVSEIQQQVENGFGVLGNAFCIEQQKTDELSQGQMLMQGGVSKIQIILGKRKKEIEDQDIATKKLKEVVEKEIDTLKAEASAYAGKLGMLEQHMNVFNMRLIDLDLRFKVQERTNYNGRLIWKIQDFRRKMNNAKRGGALSIYSQPFYKSNHGYNLCLCIYLNGVGIGKNTHISLYCVLDWMGEYDALLSFPLEHKVTLSLLEHGSERRTLTSHPSLYIKPEPRKQIEFGFQKFFSHDQLNGNCVANDMILVEAVITTAYEEIC